jgi:formamidopyrimidine-DNA glycosylase
MPELPDVEVYVEKLAALAAGQTLGCLRILNPFLLRTVDPPPDAFAGKRLRATRRIGKRVALEFDTGLFAVLHLMIAGRLRWLVGGKKPPARITLATFEFETGMLAFTEA